MGKAKPTTSTTQVLHDGNRTATVYLEKYERWVIAAIRPEGLPMKEVHDAAYDTLDEALEKAREIWLKHLS